MVPRDIDFILTISFNFGMWCKTSSINEELWRHLKYDGNDNDLSKARPIISKAEENSVVHCFVLASAEFELQFR